VREERRDQQAQQGLLGRQRRLTRQALVLSHPYFLLRYLLGKECKGNFKRKRRKRILNLAIDYLLDEQFRFNVKMGY
jgi:hypothetical protein